MKQKKILDREKSQFSQYFDREAMAVAFEDFFRREYPERGLTIKRCNVNRLYFKPGKRCSINYRLFGEDGEGREFEQMFHAKVFPNSNGLTPEADGQPESWPGCGSWKPVSIWPEMNMVLHTFPYDPRLPYLGQLLEPDFVRDQVETNLDKFGLSSDWKCDAVTVHRTKYRYGKNCVLHYEVTFSNPAAGGRTMEFYGKTYRNARSRYVYEILQKILQSPACQDGRLNIPALVAHLDDANTIWQLAWPGKNFSLRARELGWQNLPGSGYLPKIATMLAALHQVDVSGLQLEAGPSLASVVKNARGDMHDIVKFLPDERSALEEITDVLEANTPEAASTQTQTLIHGSFKIAQILCQDDQLGLVDFDSVALGDPLYDVAEFLSSLVYLAVSDQVPAESVSASVALFLKEYADQVPWGCPRARVAWYLVPFLLGKVHSSLKRRERTAVQNVRKAFEITREWLALAGA